MDEFFNKTVGAMSGLTRGLWRETSYVPGVNCFIKEGNYIVQAEIPGIDPKDVDISIVGDRLTIRGERKSSREVKDEEYLLNELYYGAFERTTTLPEGVRTDNVHASYKNGVLEVILPKIEKVKPKQIKIDVN